MKKNITGLLIAALLVSLTVGASFLLCLSAGALTSEELKLRTTDSAAVYIGTPTALRFEGKIDKTAYDNLIRNYGAQNVEVGILIAPYAAVKNMYSFTAAELDRQFPMNTIYKSVPATGWSSETTDSYAFTGLTDTIGVDLYNTEYAAIAYAKITASGVQTVYYASDYTVRSAGGVAAAAINDKMLGGDSGAAYTYSETGSINQQPTDIYITSGTVKSGYIKTGTRRIYVSGDGATASSVEASVYSRYDSIQLGKLNGIISSVMSGYTAYKSYHDAFSSNLTTLYNTLKTQNASSDETVWMLEASYTTAAARLADIDCYDYKPYSYSCVKKIDGIDTQLYWTDWQKAVMTPTVTLYPAMVDVGVEMQMQMEALRTYAEAYDAMIYIAHRKTADTARVELDKQYQNYVNYIATAADHSDMEKMLNEYYEYLKGVCNMTVSGSIARRNNTSDYFSYICTYAKPESPAVTMLTPSSITALFDAELTASAGSQLSRLAGLGAEASNGMLFIFNTLPLLKQNALDKLASNFRDARSAAGNVVRYPYDPAGAGGEVYNAVLDRLYESAVADINKISIMNTDILNSNDKRGVAEKALNAVLTEYIGTETVCEIIGTASYPYADGKIFGAYKSVILGK